MRSLIIIPARQHSTRCPDKPLRMIHGRPLLWWTYRRARETNVDNVIVTSSDKEVGNACKHFEIPFWPSTEQPTGTHRCAEVLSRVKKDFDVVVNWQCDEPCVSSEDVSRLIRLAYEGGIRTLCAVAIDDDFPTNRHRVKVRIGLFGRALDFTREPLPLAYEHIGIYAFTPKKLIKVTSSPPSPLSRCESLEQLTWLERGYSIIPYQITKPPLSINTEEDLAKAEEILSL